MHFTCRPFIGKSNTNNWSQYWENEPDDPILIHNRGHLFGLVNLGIGFKEEDLSIIGHDIIYELNQNYFSCDNDQDIQECLKNTLETVIKNPLYQSFKIEILITVILKNKIYFASYGLGKVILCRSQKISIVLDNRNEEIKNLSGPIHPEDKIFLVTDSFFNQFTWEKIKAILSNQKTEDIEEEFLSKLYTFENQGGMASVLIQPHSDEDQVLESGQESNIQEEVVEDYAPPISEPQNISFLNQIKNDPVYVSHREINQVSKRKKINLIIALLLILGLIVTFYFGYQKNQSTKNETKYQNLKSELDKKFTDISAVKNINLESAQQLARDSESIINQMMDLNIHQNELSSYQSQIQQVLSESGSTDHFTPDLFYDLSISFKNTQYSKLIFKEKTLFLLDQNNGRLDSLTIEKSGKNVLTNDKVKDIILLAQNNGELYGASKDSLFLIKNSSIESKTSFTSSSVDLIDFKFWNGAAYLLDQKNLNILKLTPNSTGFGSPQIWLKNEAKLDSTPTSLAINSNIFVLSQNGQIASYTSGIKQDFKLVQQDTVSQSSNLNVTLNSGTFVFVDNQNIIYVYKETGELQSKYNFDKLKITDIAVDEENNFVYVLCADQKIYQIKL
jgi:hypothetical protein